MSMKLIVACLLSGLLLGGCALFKQAKADIETGKVTVTPLAEGEISPTAAAEKLVAAVEEVPYGKVIAPFLTPLLVGFARYRRGKKIRLGKPVSENPITGGLGASLGLEGVVQFAANLSTSTFNLGPDGSGIKRGWKVASTIALALVSGSLLVPAVRELVVANPAIFGGITLASGFIAGIEKELGKVLPVKENV